jgi:hypothetical protein
MTDAALSLDTIDRLTGGRLGTHDVPCPLCGPYKSTHGQRRKVLRVWRIESGFAGYHCARCGEKGQRSRPACARAGPGEARAGQGRGGRTRPHPQG